MCVCIYMENSVCDCDYMWCDRLKCVYTLPSFLPTFLPFYLSPFLPSLSIYLWLLVSKFYILIHLSLPRLNLSWTTIFFPKGITGTFSFIWLRMGEFSNKMKVFSLVSKWNRWETGWEWGNNIVPLLMTCNQLHRVRCGPESGHPHRLMVDCWPSSREKDPLETNIHRQCFPVASPSHTSIHTPTCHKPIFMC